MFRDRAKIEQSQRGEMVHTLSDMDQLRIITKLIPAMREQVWEHLSTDFRPRSYVCEPHLNDCIAAMVAKKPSYKRLCPVTKDRLVKSILRRSGAVVAAGGWLENRSAMFSGCYMEKDSRFIHCGSDIFQPEGTTICFPTAGTVLSIETSCDTEIGWGTRIDIAHEILPLVFVFGHLSPNVDVVVGQHIALHGAIIGKLAGPLTNGGVEPHLHVQVMQRSEYEALIAADDLDGYRPIDELATLSWRYPEPLSTFKALGL